MQQALDTSPVIHLDGNVLPATGTQLSPPQTPLSPLPSNLSAWAELPVTLDWLINTIKCGYTLQYAVQMEQRECGLYQYDHLGYMHNTEFMTA